MAFKRHVTAALLNRLLKTHRRNGFAGNPLIQTLSDLHHDHGQHEGVYEERHLHEPLSEEEPGIILSEASV